MHRRNPYLHAMFALPLSRRALSLICACALLFPHIGQALDLDLSSSLGQALGNTSESSWVKLNQNSFFTVWTPVMQQPAPADAPSTGDPGRVITAWSSMAWDSNRGKLIFWGGGHANYAGNEIYLWDSSTLEWSRASLPSEVERVRQDVALYHAVDGPNNAPPSAHTYDSSEFLPIIDRFVVFGGAAFNTGRYFELVDNTRTGPYFWDPSKADPNAVGGTTGSQVRPLVNTTVTGGEMWENRDNLQSSPGQPKPGAGGTFWINGTTGYHQENGQDVLFIQVGSQLFRYKVPNLGDPQMDTFELIGNFNAAPFTGQGAGAYSPDRNLYLRTANNTITYWNLDTAGPTNQNVVVTPVDLSGSFPFGNIRDYGLDYDPVRQYFVIWTGTGEVFSLTPPADLTTGTWEIDKVSAPTGNTPMVPLSTTGILGKWKYIPDLDIFLGAYGEFEGQIWAFKPSAWSPSVSDPIPFITAPFNGSTIAMGATVDITVNSVDPTVDEVTVFVDDVSVATGSSVPFTTTVSTSAIGMLEIKATTVGADDIERESVPVNVFIEDLNNNPPNISLTSPSNSASFDLGQTISIAADATDSDGTIALVEFFDGGAKLGDDDQAPYTYEWMNVAPGPHNLTAVAYDDDAATMTSNVVSITVSDAPNNEPPTVSLDDPANGTSFNVGDSITLAASASDSDGSINRVEFFVDQNLIGQDNAAPFAATFNNAPTGSYTLTAVAFDDVGAQATSNAVTITVGNVQNPTNTIVLQDGLDGFSGVADTYLYEFFDDLNFGTDTELFQREGQPDKFRLLIRIPIFQSNGGSVPDDAEITSATLSLFKHSSFNHDYTVRSMQNPWDEFEATWNNRTANNTWASPGAENEGGDYSANSDGAGSTPFDSGLWVEFDVTAGVIEISQGRTNHGWRIVSDGGDGNSLRFYSSDYTTNPSLRPKLTVTYSTPARADVPLPFWLYGILLVVIPALLRRETIQSRRSTSSAG